MSPEHAEALRFELGATRFELVTSPAQAARLRRDWAPFRTEAAASEQLRWTEQPGEIPHRAPARLPRASLAGQTLVIDGDGYRARIDGADGEVVSSAADRFALESTIKLVLARRLLAHGGLLVHGVGLARDGVGALFTGHSGAGKSTLGIHAVAGGWERLGDELVAVWPEAGGVVMAGTPWNVGSPARAGLVAVGSLAWGAAHAVAPRAAGELLPLLLGNAVLVEDTPPGRAALFQAASALLRRVRTVELTFARDAAVAEALAEAVRG